jgi:FAD/FMN-containing dehydrogenase
LQQQVNLNQGGPEVDGKKQALIDIVGSGFVADDPAILESYSRDESFAAPRRPWFVVKPKDVQQVQALVQWANETATPLIPVSSGPPHFHGDTVPSVAESVIVDFGRMNAIKRIDRRNRIAVIEPGVTYGQLKGALAAEGLRISRPLLPRANKSVVASLLERQPTLIPRLNYSLPEPLRNCGVVWGSGECAFTGEAGSGSLSLEAQWEKGLAQADPKGPMATDLLRLLTGAQGSMGIVVWASIRCELIPQASRCYFVPGERLEALIDFCRRAERLRLGDELLVLNGTQLALIFGGGNGDFEALKKSLPQWIVIINLAGAALYPEERVAIQEKELKSLAQGFGCSLLSGLPGISASGIKTLFEDCSGEPYWKLRRRGGCQEIFFLTTMDKAPQFIATVNSVAEKCKYPTQETGIYIQPQHHGVSQHIEFNFPFDPANKKEAARMKELFEKASEALIAQGAYFSRPYGLWADLVYSRDATARRVLGTVKQIVDPQKVLNPGKLCF